MRRIKHEIITSIMVLALPIALVATFPYHAMEKPSAGNFGGEASAAFIKLSPVAMESALVRAHLTWQDGSRRIASSDQLPLGDLPEVKEERFIKTVFKVDRSEKPVALAYKYSAYVPGSAGNPPADQRGIATGNSEPIFSREDLLDIK